MRNARVADFRRRLQEKPQNWPLRIERLAYNAIPSLGTGELPFLSPLSVICGPNGVGKTTLLRVVWTILDSSAAKLSLPEFAQLRAGSGTLEITSSGAKIEKNLDFAATSQPDENQEIETTYVNPSVETGRIQGEFAKANDPEDIINGIGPSELTAGDLNDINYLTMRNYREVKLYEIELADEVAPFFEVTLGSDRYDSRTMGSGEFATFLLWWRLRRASAKSVLLIEEPECFLSPSSQSALVDFLIKTIYEKKICTIVSSHSAEIITPLPTQCVRFFRRGHAGVSLVTERPSPVLLETIGIKPNRDILVFVEDDAALRFCKLLAERYDPALARRMIVVAKGGEGEIISLLRQVENNYASLWIIGLFDGDAFGKVPKDVTDKASYLPGHLPVERLFKEIADLRTEELQDAVGGGDIGGALFALQGRDHHDWFLDLAKNCGLEPGQLFMALFKLWISHGENETVAKRSFGSLQEKILGSSPAANPAASTASSEGGSSILIEAPDKALIVEELIDEPRIDSQG